MIVTRKVGYVSKQCHRTFFSSSPQKFTVNKTLPHAQRDLFKVISDIDAYSTFVPYCVSSKVTERKDGLPCKADLKVGYQTLEEKFSSLVRCKAPTSVEAVASNHPLFERLVTAWRLQDESSESCKVHLDIEYKFANPMYAVLSSSVLPKVADRIITAFEKHAQEVLKK